MNEQENNQQNYQYQQPQYYGDYNQQPQQPYGAYNPYQQFTTAYMTSEPQWNFFYVLLSLVSIIAGIILYAVLKDTKPLEAKTYLKISLIKMIISIVLAIILITLSLMVVFIFVDEFADMPKSFG